MSRDRLGIVPACLLTCVLTAASLITPACGITSTLDKMDNTLQDGINVINQQSDAWRDELPKLVQQLTDLEANADADARNILNETINDVSSLRDQTFSAAESLAKDTVSYTAITAECSGSYFANSVTSYLSYLKARLRNSAAPLPTARVCTFNPDHFDIDPGTLSGSNRTWFVQVYGYNFLPASTPAVQVLDGNNHLLRNARNQPVRTSLYQMQLQLVAADFEGLAPGYRVGLVWPNGGDSNYISLNLTAPADLEIVGFQFPSSVTVNQPVLAQVTVRNTGTVDSGSFSIQWQPDASRNHPVTESILSLAGNQTKTYDLPSFTYAQADYFNIPRTQPIQGIQTVVELRGNSGVGPNSTRTASFTLDNLPFQKLQPIRITKPEVDRAWTSERGVVDVRPGDIVTITDAGGCVQTGGHGDTWKRYVDPYAPDSPNLYHGLIAIVPIMPAGSGSPPSQGTRIKDVLGQPLAIPLNTPNPQFELGYEDTDYSDDGYDSPDNGTNNQCLNQPPAWVTVQIQRN